MDIASAKKASKHLKIKATKDGKNCGFVKKIDYETGEVHLTSDKEFALRYDTEDEVQYDIDYLTKIYFESGYIFTY